MDAAFNIVKFRHKGLFFTAVNVEEDVLSG
jgi:hypothetical protein